MKHAKNSNGRLGNGGDVRRTIDDEFACPGNSTHVVAERKIEQATGGGYPFIDQDGRRRVSASTYVKMVSRSDSANAGQVSFTFLAHQL
jgi:hypothetical protein